MKITRKSSTNHSNGSSDSIVRSTQHLGDGQRPGSRSRAARLVWQVFEDNIPERDPIAVLQLVLADLGSVDRCPVRAPQVYQEEAATAMFDTGMMAGYFR